MLSLEVGDPGDSLSTLLICYVRLAGCQSERVLAGGNSDGGLQVATGRRRRSSIGWGAAGGDRGLGASVPAGDGSKLFCTRSLCLIFGLFLILVLVDLSYSAFSVLDLFGLFHNDFI